MKVLLVIIALVGSICHCQGWIEFSPYENNTRPHTYQFDIFYEQWCAINGFNFIYLCLWIPMLILIIFTYINVIWFLKPIKRGTPKIFAKKF